MTDREYQQLKADCYNAEPGEMAFADCPICHNKGQVMYLTDDDEIRLRECSCMAQRRTKANLKRSGLAEVLNTYTWDKWQEKEPWQASLRRLAEDYAQRREGWLMVSGRPGTGKTHICTAVCGSLLDAGLEVRYLLWREFTTRAKAVITEDAAYRELVQPFKAVPVLYVDDFFKTGGTQSEPTSGDCNLAFELLNARYADPKKLTIISSELPIERILEIDEAIGSRIYERSKDHCANLTGKANWRMK